MGRRSRVGFTVLELLVVVVFAAILFRLTLPKLRVASALYGLDRDARLFASDLQEAQSEAWRRNRTVTVTRLTGTQYKVSVLSGATEQILRQRFMEGGSTFSTSWGPIGFRAFGPPTLPVTAPLNIPVENTIRSRTVRIAAGGAIVLVP